MTDIRTLPAPFDQLAAVIDLAAAARNGHVAHETDVRARRSGDIVTIDVALWVAGSSGDTLCALDLAPGSVPVEVDAVEAAGARKQALDARAAAIASAAGFSRAARKRADELGIDLVDLHRPDDVAWPSWLASTGFESQELNWNLLNVVLPPLPGLPERFFESAYDRGDALFANPQGRTFTPEELVRRWLRAGNEEVLVESLPGDGSHVERPILLRFDRPMTVLANTVRPLPALASCEVLIEAWLEVTRVPMELVPNPPPFLSGSPAVAYASDPAPGDEARSRLWMWLEAGEEGEGPVLRLELFPGDGPEAPAG